MSQPRALRIRTVGIAGALAPQLLNGHPAAAVLERGRQRPDVVLCGVELDRSGAVLPELAELLGRRRTIVVSDSRSAHNIATVYALGAQGYLSAHVSADEAWQAALAVASGGQAWPEGWDPPELIRPAARFRSMRHRRLPGLLAAACVGSAALAMGPRPEGAIAAVSSALSGLALAWLSRRHASRERRWIDLAAVHARAGERARYSRILHDRTLQLLEGLRSSGEIDDPLIRHCLAEETAWLRQIVESGLQPPTGSLDDVLRATVDRYRRASLEVAYTAAGDVPPLPATVVEAFDGGVSEALNNAAKHLSTGHAWVTMSCDEGQICVDVVDRGAGFDPDAVPAGRFGIRHSIGGRMAAAGGVGSVTSTLGGGTRVRLTYPVAEREAPHRSPGVPKMRVRAIL